jgi:ATP-dependent RNA helicase DeaD
MTPDDLAPDQAPPEHAADSAAAIYSLAEPTATADVSEDGPAAPSAPDAPFAALGLGAELVAAITGLGYEEPTPIQREAIPVLLAGRDVLGVAATGTGKTAAFALPLLQRIGKASPGSDGDPRALVLVPTRELCMQVAEAVHKYGRGFGTRVLAVYGGAAMGQQLRALDRGVDVVVATPGRALDHVNRGTLKLDAVRVLVLDEADEMLDMGFEEDLTAIVGATPTERRRRSSRRPWRRAWPRRRQLPARARARRGGAPPARRGRDAQRAQPRVPRAARAQDRRARPRARHGGADECHRVLPHPQRGRRAHRDAGRARLRRRGAARRHGAGGARPRHAPLPRGQVELLVATDVAARGLDVEHVSHVVNYDVPSAPDAYVHRVGRTGRAGREGVAITIAEPRERGLLRGIERVTRQTLTILPVPTPAELRSRRSERTANAVRALLDAAQSDRAGRGPAGARDDDGGMDGLGAFRSTAEVLAADFDLLDVAAAALRLAHEATVGAADEDETEIPSLHQPAPRPGATSARRGARAASSSASRAAGSGRDGSSAVSARSAVSGRRAATAPSAGRGAARWAATRSGCS